MKVHQFRKINNKGFSHVETFLFVIVIALIVGIGGYVYIKHKSPAHAGGFSYANLGTVTWNKTNPNSKAPSTSTKYYTNSRFTFLACAIPASANSKISTVNAVAIAKDYTSYIQSGHYVPGVSVLLDKNVSNLGNKWSFGAFATGNFSASGAYQTLSESASTSSLVSFSPTPTSYWQAVWTKPVLVSKLPNCNGSVPSVPVTPPAVLSKHGFNAPISVALDSNQNNLYVQNSDYSVVRIDTNNTDSVFAPFTTDNYYYASSPTNPSLVSLFNQNSYYNYTYPTNQRYNGPVAQNNLDGTVLFSLGGTEVPITISEDGYTATSVAITTTYGYALWCSTDNCKNSILTMTNLTRNTTSTLPIPGSEYYPLNTDQHGIAYFLIKYDANNKNSCGLAIINGGDGISITPNSHNIPCGSGVTALKGFFNNFTSPELYIIDNNNTIIDYAYSVMSNSSSISVIQ